MGAFLGRGVKIEILVGADNRALVNGALPKPVTAYTLLGGTRGYSLSKEWGTVDSTSRTSVGSVRESIADYLSLSGSIDGVWLTEAAANIEATNTYVTAPPSGQPFAWIKTTRPGATAGSTITEELYVLLTSFSFEAPYDDVGTFSLDFTGLQPAVVNQVPAP
jgi:hypothetical protein